MKKPSSGKTPSSETRRFHHFGRTAWCALLPLIAACIGEPSPLPPDQALREASKRIDRILADDAAIGDAPRPQSRPDAPEDPTTLRFWAYAHPLVSHAMQRPPTGKTDGAPGAAFMALHPEVRLNYQFIGEWDIAIQKLTVCLAAGDLPDVALVKRGWLARLAASGLIAPINDVAPPALFDDLLPNARASVTYQGKVYALPADGFCSALLYNRELVTSPPRNWDELQQWAAGFVKRPSVPNTFETKAVGCFPFVEALWSAGGEVCDGKAARLDSGEAKAALGFALSLRDSGCAGPETLFDARTGLACFLAGRCAVTVTSTEYWPRASSASFRAALAPVPGKTGPISRAGDNVLVVFARHAAAKRDAIASLLDYLTGFQNLGAAAVEKGSAPIRASVADALKDSESARNLGAIYAAAKFPPLLPSWNAIEFELDRALGLASRWKPESAPAKP